MYNMRECELEGCNEVFEPYPANKRFCDPSHKREAENRRRRELVEDVVTAIETREEDEDDNDDYLDFLRRENRRLANLAEKRKFQKYDAAEEMYRAAFDALSSIELKPVKEPKPKSAPGPEEFANPLVADLQIGKGSATYSPDICRDRVEQYGDKVVSITDVQRSDHPVNHAHVHLLGDFVENECTYPGQQNNNLTSLYQQMVDGVEIVSDFLRRMLSNFETVHVAACSGNHGTLRGRDGPFDEESNMDRLLYKFLEMMFRDEPRITFQIPEGQNKAIFYVIDNVDGHRQLLVHGDQFPKPTSLHQYHKMITGWASGAIDEKFDSVVLGHWHQNMKFTVGGGILVKIVGSSESDNSYALENLARSNPPTQGLQFIRGDVGITAEYDIKLD